jgi:hypothetical protein
VHAEEKREIEEFSGAEECIPKPWFLFCIRKKMKTVSGKTSQWVWFCHQKTTSMHADDGWMDGASSPWLQIMASNL